MSTIVWTTKTSIPVTKSDFGAAYTAYGGAAIYAIGGLSAGSAQSSVYAYSISGNSWTSKTSLPAARSNVACAAIFDDRVVIFAGKNSAGTVVSTTYIYDPTGDSWTTGTAMPTAGRYDAGAVEDRSSSYIFVIGGATAASSAVNTNQRYFLDGDSWTTRAAMTTARRALGVAIYDGVIYAIGGINSSGTVLDTVEAYSISGNSWSTKAVLPAARSNAFCFEYNGKIYAVGGKDSFGNVVDTVYEYDPGTNAWSTATPSMTSARSNGVAVGHTDGRVLVLGGVNSGLSAVSTNEQFSTTGSSTDTVNISSVAQITTGIIVTETISSTATILDNETTTIASTALIAVNVPSDATVLFTTTATLSSDAYVSQEAYIPVVSPGSALPGPTKLGVCVFASSTATILSTATISLYSTSAQTTVVDVIMSPAGAPYVLDLNSVQPPHGYQNYDWAYDWVVRTYNRAQCKFEARSADTLPALISGSFSLISQGQIIPRAEVKRYHQWRAHVWASGSGDFELHQFTIKAYVDHPAYPYARTLTPQVKASVSSITLGTPVDQPDIII